MGTIVAWIIFLEYLTRGLLSSFASRKLCHAGCGAGMMCLDSSRLDARCFVWVVAASSIAMTWNLSPLPAFRFSRPHDVGVTAYLLLVSAWFYLQLPAPILAPVFFADPGGAVVGKLCSQYIPALNPVWLSHDRAADLFDFGFVHPALMYGPLLGCGAAAWALLGGWARAFAEEEGWFACYVCFGAGAMVSAALLLYLGFILMMSYFDEGYYLALPRRVAALKARGGGKTLLGSAAVLALTYATIAFPCSPVARGAIAAAAMLAEGLGGDYDNLALAGVVLAGWRWTA